MTRRKAEIAPITRGEIRKNIERIQGPRYPEKKILMYRSLFALAFIAARRISELVGRVYAENKTTGFRRDFAKGPKQPENWTILDVYKGIMTDDFKFVTIAGKSLLSVRFQVLKKYVQDEKTGKTKMKKIIERVDVPVDFFVEEFVMPWVKLMQNKAEIENTNLKVYSIGRSRAFQVITEFCPNLWTHYFRHQRLTHLASVLNPFELKDNYGKWSSLDPAVFYVHSNPERIADKTREADEKWKGI